MGVEHGATSRMAMLTSGGSGDLVEVDSERGRVLGSDHGERRKRSDRGEGAHLVCDYEYWAMSMMMFDDGR